ncbi:hypothetical protein NSP_25520 [Nodularia spumigena CCY9414]|nr:hypothetical protein NSP_25520 [Nodularia spumigena CCY9414]
MVLLLRNLVVGRPSGVDTPLSAELPISKPKNALTEPAPSIRINNIKVKSTVEFIFIADKLLRKMLPYSKRIKD